jgi:hypothetical protein
MVRTGITASCENEHFLRVERAIREGNEGVSSIDFGGVLINRDCLKQLTFNKRMR